MKRRAIATEFWNGDTVHHRMADEDHPGIVTAVQFNPGGSVMYRVTWRSRAESWVFESELTSEKPSQIPEPPKDGGTTA